MKTFKIKRAGCLYTYTGTEQHYCFKELPKVEVKVNAKEYNMSRPCLAIVIVFVFVIVIVIVFVNGKILTRRLKGR